MVNVISEKKEYMAGLTGMGGGPMSFTFVGASGPSSLDNEGYYVQFNEFLLISIWILLKIRILILELLILQ